MIENHLLRWIFIAIFAVTFGMSAYFRRLARRSGDVIPRAREGRKYMINPEWMAWSSFRAPTWIRWVGAAIGLAMLPVLYWILASIGSNISETTLTKSNHVLVTHGPYRWIRHPLYAVATTVFVALGLLAANWFIVAVALLAGALIRFVRAKKRSSSCVSAMPTGSTSVGPAPWRRA